jgi:uncharacterized SAM-binding protein YcdF (DUF218 family)
LFERLGVAPGRILLDDRSRNTSRMRNSRG